MAQSRRRSLAAGLLLLWLVSLALPAVDTDTEVVRGWMILIIGWLGPLMLQFGCFANFLLPFALVLAARREPGQWVEIILGAVLAILVVNAMFWRIIPNDDGNHPIIAFRSGYFCWLAVMVASAFWLIVQGIRAGKSEVI
jgi:hypothetical protein